MDGAVLHELLVDHSKPVLCPGLDWGVARTHSEANSKVDETHAGSHRTHAHVLRTDNPPLHYVSRRFSQTGTNTAYSLIYDLCLRCLLLFVCAVRLSCLVLPCHVRLVRPSVCLFVCVFVACLFVVRCLLFVCASCRAAESGRYGT